MKDLEEYFLKRVSVLTLDANGKNLFLRNQNHLICGREIRSSCCLNGQQPMYNGEMRCLRIALLKIDGQNRATSYENIFVYVFLFLLCNVSR